MNLRPIRGKKGMQQVVNVILAIPVIVIVGVIASVMTSFGGTILQEFQDTQTVNELDHNVTSDAMQGLATYSGFLPTIWLVIAIVVIVALLFAVLATAGIGKV